MKAITRSYLIENYVGTSVPGNGSQLNFQNYPELLDVWVCGIEVVNNTYLTVSPSGKTVVKPVTGMVLNLLDKNTNIKIYNYPLFDLIPANVGGYYRDFEPFKLNLVKSYITILSNAGINANESICFNVLYIREEDYLRMKNQPKK